MLPSDKMLENHRSVPGIFLREVILSRAYLVPAVMQLFREEERKSRSRSWQIERTSQGEAGEAGGQD